VFFGIQIEPSIVIDMTDRQDTAKEQTMRKFINEAPWDRIVRVVLGIAMLYIGFGGVVEGAVGIGLGVVGLVLLVTGLVGFCPLYAMFGVKTSDDHSVTTS
jgi:hypothetical protein